MELDQVITLTPLQLVILVTSTSLTR